MELVRPAVVMIATMFAVGAARGEPQMRTTHVQGTTHLTMESREADVYMKKPAGEGTWPAVVLLHDAMGLTPVMKTLADRLAAEGFIVYAPDMYAGKIALDADKGRELSAVMDEEAALGAVEEMTSYLRGLKEVGNHRVGVVGFDLGGRVGLKATMGVRDVSALVLASSLPHADADALRRIGCPILALFGGKDASISATDRAAFDAALKQAGRSSDVRTYDNAGHGLMVEGDPGYSAADATEAWNRMVAFLKENL